MGVYSTITKKAAVIRGGAGQGLLGQGANFAAMVVPVALGRVDQMAYVVVISAVSSIAARICGLAFPALYPVLPEEKADESIAATMRVTVTACLAAAVVGALLLPFTPHWGAVLLWIAAMTAGMVFYQVVNAIFVRRSQYREYGTVRLIYGAVNVTMVLAVSLLTDWTPALVATGCAAYAVGWLVAERYLGLRLWRFLGFGPVRDTVAYARRHGFAILGQSIDVIGSQGPAMSVAGVGNTTSLGAVWVGLQRIAGGVATTFAMLVAPVFDMRVADAVRAGDAKRTRAEVGRAVALTGGAAVAAAVATVGATIIMLSWSRRIDAGVMLLLLLTVFCFFIFLSAVVNKYLLMIGRPGTAAAWSTARAIIVLVILGLATGGHLAIAMIIQSAVLNSLYLIVLFLMLRTGFTAGAGRAAPVGEEHIENGKPDA